MSVELEITLENLSILLEKMCEYEGAKEVYLYSLEIVK